MCAPIKMSIILLSVLAALRVAFVGDPQVDNATQLNYARQTVYATLRARTDLDLVIVLGDIVNEKLGLIKPSEDSLDSLSCPWFRVNGNHDGPNPPKDTSIVRSGVRFVLMDNVRRHRKNYSGGFSAHQKLWLDSLAKASPSQEKWVVCTHIPMSVSTGRDSIYNIFSQRKDLLLVCGHTHAVDRRILERDIEEVQAGASCGTWWRGRKGSDGIPSGLMNCGAPRGYFIADFPSSRKWYKLTYQALGRPADEQFSITQEGGRIIANVYGGSREGNASVKINGKWIGMRHSYEMAPEVKETIEWNASMPREYRKTHKEEFIPMRRLPSPHIWTTEGSGQPTVFRYHDRNMTIKHKLK